METAEREITDEYDKEFIILITEIENRMPTLPRHDQLRIKSWSKKLCQITNNTEWKKNRNLHAICLLDSILNNRFEDPYNKFAPEGAVPIINKTLVKAKLSQKFIKSSGQIFKNFDNDNNENINVQNNYNVNNNINNEEGNEMQKMKERIENENKKKDAMIKKLKEDNLKYEKRIQELEKMLSTFMKIKSFQYQMKI